MYESKGEAITALYEYKLGELSNFCTFDPARNTIFAHAFESSVPNPAVLRQAGLEVLWLPMEGEICQMSRFKGKTQEKNEYSRDEEQTSIVAEQEKYPAAGQGRLLIDNSGFSLDLSTPLAHNEGIVQSDLNSLECHESQLGLEADLINPYFPSSTLKLNPASPQREKEQTIFDDDFFLEVDPDVARSFLGSQYTEEGQYYPISDTHLLPNDILGTSLPSEQLRGLDDNGQDVKLMKTWGELARDYLAKHPAQTVQSSVDDEDQGVMPINTWAELAREYLAECPVQPTHGFGNTRKPTDDDFIWNDSFNASSGRTSPIDPCSEHAESINSAHKDFFLKGRYSRRFDLSSIVAHEVSLKLRKGNYSFEGKESIDSRRERPIGVSDDVGYLVTIDTTAEEASLLNTSELLAPSTVRECSACAVPSISFPTNEVSDESSRRSSISLTSYIEGERARERLYQTYDFQPGLMDEENAGVNKTVAKSRVQVTAIPKVEKNGSKLLDTAETVGQQLDRHGFQKVLYETKVESEYSGEKCGRLRNSVMALASMVSLFRPTEDKEHMAGMAMSHDPERRIEGSKSSAIALPIETKLPKHREMAIAKGIPKNRHRTREPSGTPTIPLPTGFRFTNHRLQMMRSEEFDSLVVPCSSSFNLGESISGEERGGYEDFPNRTAIENTALTGSSRLEKPIDISASSSIEDFVGEKENNAEGEDLRSISNLVSRDRLQARNPSPNIQAWERAGSDESASDKPKDYDEFAFPNDWFHMRNSSRKAQTEGGDGCDEPSSEMVREHNVSPFRKSLGQSRHLSCKAQMDDLNTCVIGGATRQDFPRKKEGRVGALVDIFQANSLMPSKEPALHREGSPTTIPNKSGSRPTTPTARIVTPSGGMYHPGETLCVPAGCLLSRSPIKRATPPMSPFFRPSSGFSAVDTDVSELFGKIMVRTEKHSAE
jgi:hypothetical protein